MLVERMPKAGKNSLGWYGQLAWSVCQVSNIIITLRNDDAHVTQHQLMSTIEGSYPSIPCRSRTWDNVSLASLPVYMAHSMTDNDGGGWTMTVVAG
jgi:hypothetical protein